MAATAEPVSTPAIRLADHSPAVLAAIAFAILFSKPAVLLVRDWWNDPDAGHGLLLAPLAIWLAWRSGLVPARPARVSGALILTGAVLLRYLSGLAAELFTMTSYVFRVFEEGPSPISVYVGYYDHQTQGKTIHSPKNCLPGSGWEALEAAPIAVTTANGPVTVNRYLLQNKNQQALVFYWY